MSRHRVVVKYYDSRMLVTCDINAIFMALFEKYGESTTVEFLRMNDSEQREVVEEVRGIPLIQERFRIFDMIEPDAMHRRPDVEDLAISTGKGKGVRKKWDNWCQGHKGEEWGRNE